MEVDVDDKDSINKQPTSEAEAGRDAETGIVGNVREKGQDPSPDDRERGERSDAEGAGAEEADRG
jgi:hypothetical protein